MNSDAYSFAKSSMPQSVSEYTPYSEKNWQWINDINSGVYTPSNTLVQFDLTSIYNSNQFADSSDLFLAIPIVMSGAWTTSAGAGVTPVAGHNSLLSLKTNFQHLIHQIEVVANGKVVNDTQPFVSLYEHFKLASQMSQNDLKQFGPSWGWSQDGLDNEKSVRFTTESASTTAGTGSLPGCGLTNNTLYAGGSVVGSDIQPISGPQNTNAVNRQLVQRANRIVDASSTSTSAGGGTVNGIYGSYAAGGTTRPAIMTASQLASEAKPYYSINSDTYTMVWQDVAVIPLKYLCDCLDKMGLVKKLDLVLRVYMNTGTMSVLVANAADSVNTYKQVVTNTFVNTVPFSINYMGATTTAANGGIPTTATRLNVGLFVAKSNAISWPGSTSGTFSQPALSHYLPAVRCYYSLVKLEPNKALAYMNENRSKKVVFENILFNQYTNIPAGGTFSQLIQSGIKRPLGVCIIPLISSLWTIATTNSVSLGSVSGGEQYQSPYDMCPGTFAPISLTNLQVALGGVNQLQASLYYSFENFLEQVGLAESLTSTDLGIGTGLISQSWWEMNRVYWVDLSRGRQADKDTMRNLTISFNNNSQAIITLMVYTVYLDEITVDVETGAVRK
jgi:hypothetical protein